MEGQDNELKEFKFLVNNVVIQLCVDLSDQDLCQKLTNDDLYTFQYIYMLGEQNVISVDGPVTDVQRILENENIRVLTDSQSETFKSGTDTDDLAKETQLCNDPKETPVVGDIVDEIIDKNPAVYTKPTKAKKNSKCDVDDKVSTTDSSASAKGGVNHKLELWNDKQTSFLLEKYDAYVPHVGPMKKFKTKKVLWKKISEDLLQELSVTRDYVQVENRYKTCLKRKKTAVEHNAKSGNTREEVPFEEELSKIAANDDSIEPEVLCSAKRIKYLKEPPQKNPSPKRKSMQELAEELHNKKEDAKERRHQEKLSLITSLLQKKQE